jgi:DNA (cytosine-5)-methyltransferase 1
MIGIDLFAGAGGLSLGALRAGIDVKYGVEIDPYACLTYKKNHKNTILLENDISSINADFFKDIRTKKDELVIFGGPPCQGFSTSNQRSRDLNNEKNWLFLEYIRLVEELDPKYVVFENVKGIFETEQKVFFNLIVESFEKLGFKVNYFILNAANYGVPQNRNRLFIIGVKTKNKMKEPNKKKEIVCVGDAINDLPIIGNGNRICKLPYSAVANSEYAELMRNDSNICHNNLVSRNSTEIIERYTHIPQGGNWENIPKDLMKNYKDVSRCHTGIYRRLTDTMPSVTIGNYRKSMLIHPWYDRGLSVREAARLQSFPDEFHFYGSIGFQQQQVGNAVPPLLAEAVFLNLRNLV